MEIAYRDREQVVTYSQLYDDVGMRSDGLIAAGLKPQDRVTWLPRNDYSTLVELWAILHTGAIVCPISQRIPPSKQLEIANQLRAKWLDDFAAKDVEIQETKITQDRPHRLGIHRDTALPATIILSSGSTGTPKAIVHSLSAHIASALGAAARIPLTPGDGWLWALPAFHVGGLSIPFRCALAGATVCGVGEKDRGLALQLATTHATHLSLVPTQLRRLLASRADLSTIKAILVGGMAVPPVLMEAAVAQGLPIHTTYGLTEMASQVTTSGRVPSSPLSSGTTLPHRELTIGTDGEILVRGATLCLGALADGVVHSVTDADGWFHTRDRGRLSAQGELQCLGRMDNMFISGGENIYPESIEQELLGFNGVEQVVVVPRVDAEFGNRPVAFVDADVLDTAAWNASLRERLAGFEIPIAYLPWPNDAELSIKPDREKLRAIANS